MTASIPPPADQRHTEPAPYTGDDDSPDLASARLRRPNAAVQSPTITAVPAPGDDAGGGRGWLGTLLLLILALLVGGGLAVLAVLWLWPERAVEVVEQPPVVVEQPPAVVAVTPSPPIPAEPAPTIVPEATIRDRVGPPIEAPEPPVTAAPQERPAPAATSAPAPAPAATPTPAPAETAAVSSPRIVVHHGDDQESSAVAEQLASQLLSAGIGQVEVRAVKFDVATASVRYFFDQDRAGAERLTAAIGPFLSWHGRAAPSTPIGFTDFRPLPRQGTIEIWLPRR